MNPASTTLDVQSVTDERIDALMGALDQRIREADRELGMPSPGDFGYDQLRAIVRRWLHAQCNEAFVTLERVRNDLSVCARDLDAAVKSAVAGEEIQGASLDQLLAKTRMLAEMASQSIGQLPRKSARRKSA